MEEFIKKLIERLEVEVKYQVQKEEEAHLDGEKISTSMARQAMGNCYNHAIEIVSQLAEEYKQPTITIEQLLAPNPKRDEFLKMEFSHCIDEDVEIVKRGVVE